MISVNDLKYTTVFIADNTEEPRHSFTGFIIKLATSQGESYFLCSCGHCFDKNIMNISFVISAIDENEEMSGITFNITVSPIKHPSLDIAYVDITNTIIKALNKYNIIFHFIEESDIILNDDRSSFNDLEDVYLVGYQAALWYTILAYPFIIKGNTASSIQFNFQNGFFTYANTKEGLSGCPVYIKVNEKYKLLGIHHSAKIRSLKITTDEFEKKYEESLGLSQEVYAFYILDFIREQYPLVTEK